MQIKSSLSDQCKIITFIAIGLCITSFALCFKVSLSLTNLVFLLPAICSFSGLRIRDFHSKLVKLTRRTRSTKGFGVAVAVAIGVRHSVSFKSKVYLLLLTWRTRLVCRRYSSLLLCVLSMQVNAK